MKWIKFEEQIPSIDGYSYLVAGYEFFGIATWKNQSGWQEVYMGDFPFGPRFYEKDTIDGTRAIIKYWCELPEYPE
jgi:hypothetical protein